MKNPSTLRSFDWQDQEYFDEFSTYSVEDKLSMISSDIDSIRRMIKNRLSNNPGQDSYVKQTVRLEARLCRITCRDLKMGVNLLMKHLGQIEVMGEWK